MNPENSGSDVKGVTVSAGDVVTSDDLAAHWKVTPRWVMDKSRLLKDPLPSVKLDRRTVRFLVSEANHWFDRHRSSGRAESWRRTR